MITRILHRISIINWLWMAAVLMVLAGCNHH